MAISGFHAINSPPIIPDTKFARTVKPMTTPTDLNTTENIRVRKMIKMGPVTLRSVVRRTSHVTEPSNVSEKANATIKMKKNWANMTKVDMSNFDNKIRSRE